MIMLRFFFQMYCAVGMPCQQTTFSDTATCCCGCGGARSRPQQCRHCSLRSSALQPAQPRELHQCLQGEKAIQKARSFLARSGCLSQMSFFPVFVRGCLKAAFKCSFCIVSTENHADAGLKRSQTQNCSNSASSKHLLTGGPQGHVFHCTFPPHVPRGSEPGQTARLVAAAV